MKLSVITINYNNRAGLQRTIDSVICQTWKDYEWIVIDGGSTDGSKELIEQYQDHFAYWRSEPDKGVYNAMNKGIAEAKGDYLIFMNSGDCFASPSVLEEVNPFLNTADIVYGFMMRAGVNGQPNNASMMKSDVKWYDFYSDTLPHQSSFIKHDLFNKYGHYDESYRALADWKFFAICYIHYNVTVRFVPMKISVYECGGISDGRVGQLECSRLRNELFPSKIADDIPWIKTVDEIRKYAVFRIIYSLLCRSARWWHTIVKR